MSILFIQAKVQEEFCCLLSIKEQRWVEDGEDSKEAGTKEIMDHLLGTMGHLKDNMVHLQDGIKAVKADGTKAGRVVGTKVAKEAGIREVKADGIKVDKEVGTIRVGKVAGTTKVDKAVEAGEATLHINGDQKINLL